MIDRTMIQRLLVQIGLPDATIHDKGMELARAIYAAGMEDEREQCAKECERAAGEAEADQDSTMHGHIYASEARHCAGLIRMRSNA